MNILVDIRPLLDTRYSGVSLYTLEMLRALLRHDQQNTYTLFYNALRPGRELPAFTEPNVRVAGWHYPNKLLNYGSFRWLNRPRVDRALKADIVFLPHFNFIGLGETPSVAVVHDLSFLRHPHYFSVRQNVWHNALQVKKFLRQRDAVIAVSEHTKRDLIELAGVPEKKITVIYSGLAPEFKVLDPTDTGLAAVQTHYHLPKDFILYLGNLEPRKNVEGIIEAYSLYREHNPTAKTALVIAGSPAWKHSGIQRAALASRFRDDILFLDYVPDEHRTALYNLARVFMFPSFYEGFGFPPLEAMACGTPVIVSNLSALPETAGPAALAANPHDIGELAHALETLLHEREAYDLLRAEGLEWVKRYDWDTAAEKVLNIFQKVV